MAKNTLVRGATSVIRHIFISDSASTTGAGKTGLAFNTASLVAYYVYPGGTATALTLETITTLGTYAAPTSAAHMRFKEVDATNMPGLYEVQFHNDWLSVASARAAGVVQMKGATGMAPVLWEFDQIGFDIQDVDPGVDVTHWLGATAPANTGDAFARLGAAGAGLTDIATAANLATVLSRLSAARAGYLDFLNIGGNVASSAEATAIQNNTRVVRVVPTVIERPDSGTATYRIELFLYDDAGAMEAPDSAPTIALVNQAGTDLSARLDSATMALVETGRYRAIYTASVGDTLEQLLWAFSVVEGGATRKYGNQSVIVDTTAVDFTAADRTKLDTLHDTRLTAARAALLDQLDPATAGTAAAEIDVLISRLTALRAAALDEVTAARMAALSDWVDGGRLDLILDIIAADTTTDLPTLINALNNLSAAQVTSAVPTAAVNASALLLLANGIESGYTLQDALRLMSAILCGKVSGGPGSPVFRNMPDTANRVAATADASGNRTVVTLTP